MSATIELSPSHSAVRKTMGLTGCANCKLLGPCGGHDKPILYSTGCASFAGEKATDTDDMNPHFPERFWHLWNDVEGLYDYSVSSLNSIDPFGLPKYVPQLQGRTLRPPQALKCKVVALRLFQVVTRNKRGYGVRFRDAGELRRAYGIAPDARVILVGVDKDRPLESFWENQSDKLCAGLAALGLEVTIPNYSFFTCVPRFQILRNRKRILMVSQRLSRAGVRVAIHVNALTNADWSFWIRFLREHTEVSTIAVEFQTGPLASRVIGQQVFDELDNLIERVGRPIHILMIGAGRFYRQARERRWCFTIIDSEPYMFAQKRRMVVKDSSGEFTKIFVPTQKGAPVYSLFEATLKVYEKMLAAGTESPRDALSESPNQTAFLW